MSPLPNLLRRISAGPILSEDGKHMEGSLFIFEGDSKEVTGRALNCHADVTISIYIYIYGAVLLTGMTTLCRRF